MCARAPRAAATTRRGRLSQCCGFSEDSVLQVAAPQSVRTHDGRRFNRAVLKLHFVRRSPRIGIVCSRVFLLLASHDSHCLSSLFVQQQRNEVRHLSRAFALRRSFQYFFIRSLTAFLAAADILLPRCWTCLIVLETARRFAGKASSGNVRSMAMMSARSSFRTFSAPARASSFIRSGVSGLVCRGTRILQVMIRQSYQRANGGRGHSSSNKRVPPPECYCQSLTRRERLRA
jgi:hypothetical protein